MTDEERKALADAMCPERLELIRRYRMFYDRHARPVAAMACRGPEGVALRTRYAQIVLDISLAIVLLLSIPQFTAAFALARSLTEALIRLVLVHHHMEARDDKGVRNATRKAITMSVLKDVAKVRPELAGLVVAWRNPLFNDFVHVGEGLACFPSGTPADAACIKVVLDTCTLNMLAACVLAGPPGTIPDPSLLKDLAEQGSR